MIKKINATIINIGMHEYSPKFTDNKLNSRVWIEIANKFKKIDIIAQSNDFQFSKDNYKNINLYCIPKTHSFLDYFLFIAFSFLIGIKIYFENFKLRKMIYNGSEIIGGFIALIISILPGATYLQEIQGENFKLSKEQYSLIKAFFIRWLSKFCCSFAKKVRVVSKIVGEEAKSAGINPNKIIYVPTRVDLKFFNYNKYKNSDLRKRLRLDKNKVVLYIGRFHPDKGTEYLIKAMPKVLEQVKDAKLFLIGGGEQEQYLKNLTKKIHINKDIIFYGKVEHDKIPEYYTIGDVFVMPSISEGMGRSALEAMAMKNIIIASKVGGLKQIIINNKNGILTEPGNPDEIAKWIIKILKNKNSFQRLRANAYENVKEFSWETAMKKYINYFEEGIRK